MEISTSTPFGVIVECMDVSLKRISAGILAFCLVLSPAVMAEDVYRWTDENGEVHYGRTLPPEYADKPHEIRSADSIL